VVSIPLSFFGGIGGASRRGILVKGGNYLDALNRVEAVVFDKTGTLTRGFFTVAAILPAEGRSVEDVLRLAALAESNSNHPIAASIKREAAARGFSIDGDKTVSYSEIAGRGVRLQMEGKSIRAGSRALLEEEGIACPETITVNGAADSGDGTPGSAKDGTLVYVAEDGRYAGVLVIADELKKDSPETIASLKKAGIKTVMFTGDSKAAAEAISKKAGIDEYYAELLPWEKVDKLEELEATTGVHGRGGSGAAVSKTNRRPGNIVFVGDGINDAPVLARSGVGIAMGGLGSDAAIESADIVLMTDEPGKIIEAIDVARQTRNIVRQNIVFSLGVKAVLLVLGALGIASLWAAVFGDVGVALIAVLNAARAYGGKAA
jgi:Cd2+/Zn2+-exporting ATPase